MRTFARTAGSDPQRFETLLPCPFLGAVAQQPADSAAAHAIAYDKAANHSEGLGLQPALDRNLDPGDDFSTHACDERCLLGGYVSDPRNPCGNLVCAAGVASCVASSETASASSIRIARMVNPLSIGIRVSGTLLRISCDEL